MTTPEQYKAYIVDMLDGISDEKRLKQIFTIVHRMKIRVAYTEDGVES